MVLWRKMDNERSVPRSNKEVKQSVARIQPFYYSSIYLKKRSISRRMKRPVLRYIVFLAPTPPEGYLRLCAPQTAVDLHQAVRARRQCDPAIALFLDRRPSLSSVPSSSTNEAAQPIASLSLSLPCGQVRTTRLRFHRFRTTLFMMIGLLSFVFFL
jgi:hypothetical protein